MSYPISQAVRFLRDRNVAFTPHLYTYVAHGGTAEASRQLGVDERKVIKTIVMEDDQRRPLLALMHGDKEVSTQKLARFLGVKRVQPCSPQDVTRHTGYLVGGTSPFGTRSNLQVFAERSIADLDVAYVNGGKRGFLVAVAPAALISHLDATLVEVAA